MSAIRESARGEDCQMRFYGVCNFTPATTVWAHANGSAAGKGIGMKSIDELGAYLCSDCHDLIDRRRPIPHGYTRQDVELAFHQAHQRSLVILAEKGLLGRRAA